MVLLLLAIYFIACEILVQKDIMPKVLKNYRAGKLILVSLVVILTLAVISFYIKYAVILVILSTIYLSVVISNYYLKEFQKMERGKKI
ncbi:hypothetical protein ACFQAV_10565 [Companilactobacillus huachuanensis]|uniref:Uncharacterized protein n=1 Tax=Companilactobacillus huachuanensis TaxID=2559914 RepID=A0ABW1RMF5_9LACO|nr:hypothetical protein [Companilactobacillus huachuanensis]